ncbi:MAG: linear amide C-N hydrolase [Ruminiclostridium sp.]|jgi:hypothetical protein|nr:linear amide C-N hydrolase [Ruminiclostridium sp.]
MKHKRKIIITLLLLFVVICGTVILLNLNRLLTIMSLKQVDDYPLYYMRYYGDYNLDYSPVDKNFKPIDSASATTDSNTVMCSSFFARNEKGDPLFCRNLDYTLLGHPITVLLTDTPGKNASLSMADLFYLGYNKDNPPNKSLFDNNILIAPRITIDGVNEYGLAIASLTVPHAEPPFDSEKPSTDEVGMIRLVLDYATTVDEAVEKIKEYNMVFHTEVIHYMIADANGDSAIIEYIDGEIVLYRTDEPWQACTNFIFSLESSNKYCERYAKAVERLDEKKGILSEEDAMQLLSDITQDGTVWSVVYNLKTGKAYIAMGKKFDEVREFDLNMINE